MPAFGLSLDGQTISTTVWTVQCVTHRTCIDLTGQSKSKCVPCGLSAHACFLAESDDKVHAK